MRTPLEKTDVSVGRPVAFDVYDKQGPLLLRRGNVIGSDAQLERLMHEGLHGDVGPDRLKKSREQLVVNISSSSVSVPKDPVSVFQMICAIKKELQAILFSRERLFASQIMDLAREVRNACELDSDAALAAILLDRDGRYPARQALNAAILSSLVLQHHDGQANHLSTVAAALTMDIGMLSLQQTLYGQAERLTPTQAAALRDHPTRGVELLPELGVENNEWLTIVAQHHEAFDGSGYPDNLPGCRISMGGQIVAAADKYCAMVSERSYRAATLPNLALKQLLVAHRNSISLELASRLIKEISVHPPGTVVSIANGDVGMVVKRTSRPDSSVVR